jgi:Zinc dependent phospholipase C
MSCILVRIPMTCRLQLARFLLCLLMLGLVNSPAGAYSVLSHEEVVDMAWRDTIIPMLRARFPGITPDDIRTAHAYAYGGSVIQDIGYYPFGSHFFSDLLHYVRPEDFVTALIRDSTTPDEYAFALGALAHYCGDTVGHPAVNVVTAQENPKLEQKFGPVVTYAENPTAHIRTEFGFDVVEVSHGHYLQENYRDFIGFQVAKPLLEKAFLETYGIPMSSVMTHEDLAINTYRKSVSAIIPTMTKIAYVTYKDQIQKAAPGIDKRKFIYRLDKTEFRHNFGNEYTHLSFGGHIVAFFLKLMPKVGPFKALKVSIPSPAEQDVYLKSVNSTVDQYKLYLAQIQAAPAPLPPPTAQDAADAQTAAGKLRKDAAHAEHDAGKATDPDDKARKEHEAQVVGRVADHASASAAAEKSEADAIAAGGPTPSEPGALPPGSPIAPPSTPQLSSLDLDTGRPSAAGEYELADQTYAQILAELVKPTSQSSAHAAPPDAALAARIEQFFANPVPRTGPAPTPKEAAKEAALAAQVKANLATLKSLQPPPAISPH